MNELLWSKLSAFSIDHPGAQFAFSDRLARENNWSAEFTARVIEEYKRFIYLCCEAGHPVSPSEEVDQVWHLHLCYTRSYWNALCRDVLGQPVHHGPTQGGADERAKFHDWYERTLTTYQAHFGSPPPEDIWPSSKLRFARKDQRLVDVSKHWVLPRSALWKSVAAVGILTSLAGCTHLVAQGDDGELWLAIIVLAVIVVVLLISKLGKGGGGRGGSGGGYGSSCGNDCGSDSSCGSSCGGGCGGD
ncbi:hypothetical protein JIN77_07790 [Verrucomicrobiaceae bacterium R5-34]|uniref:TIGR04222 domain-containing membrane protein n=1 Tax=Oceaniferula flava TaxID=2800421 RepID=A0AAE2SE18_9BACT|nr:hypothetical protein [Oceaniferula flavus]MBK1830623.1 hypothetical protein [Verrucomicrobiaceae bacterium R5-34]MBK1856576.1 hypothetical protein [Oceaniferula flavus]MBM1137883.1 hypothetical protein [Oceaniferula flavus]